MAQSVRGLSLTDQRVPNRLSAVMVAGIVDPTKVERVALQNAASIASLLLTTEVVITDSPPTSTRPDAMLGRRGGAAKAPVVAATT